MKLVPQFIAALFAEPEIKPADLSSLSIVRGGVGIMIHRTVNRYAAYAAAIAGGSEQNDLVRNEEGEWDLVNTKKLAPDNKPVTEITGTYKTLEEGLPHLRAASDALKTRFSGFFNAMAGHAFLDETGPESLIAAERAVAQKNGPASPQP
ncbi:MAG TPA: hypothetical protein VL625_13355 [Patescibacteria group bacterium]|nr:hypothetical protein [Patescibacteria group bacterium]